MHALSVDVRCIRAHTRRSNDLATRYGDEEFVAVLPDTGERGAAKLAIASEKSPPRPYRARTRSTNFTK
ncbi:diguanylate cyclase [Burkholderia cenocepacia]|nr:diguanylate cyclase [Burkholderia sp. CpTa8-5]MBP0711701.1 diguanylate cyclase [Burkholderia sp. AcTa6-5]QVN15303.1 diguanylate cyclase [Burkholderia sp. LAS2]RQU27559.1 diguanylate cyclase [Burkholderia cenocepacia]RQU77896.1 diguanylate cyclase [Burkholderia cenocepacia]